MTLNTTPTKLEVTGPLGSISVPFEPYMHLNPAGNGIVALSVDDATQKKQRNVWGLTRTLISNAIVGMTEGLSVPLYLVPRWRMSQEGRRMVAEERGSWASPIQFLCPSRLTSRRRSRQ